jgi:outer membrane protein OmpA-like peptidoglycan-associated protein
MLKKVLNITALLGLLVFSGSAFAQSEPAEFPQYGFWSNWAIGINGSFNWQPQTELNNNYGNNLGWGKGLTAGLGLRLQKEIDRGVGVRIRYNHPSVFAKYVHPDGTNEMTTMNCHHYLTAELMMAFNNWFHLWDPNRKWVFYIFGGAGPAISGNDYYENSWGSAMLDAGLGTSVKIGEKSSLFAEVEADIVSDIPAFFLTGVGFHHTNFLFNLGYLYNLGVTAADRELMAQRALVSKDQVDALTEENDNVKEELANAKKNEQRLKDQVKQLTDENNRMRQEAVNRAQDVSDSLSNVINKLKADQLNYYAIPFSVLYDNDDWHVSEAEMVKVKAVSRVMKDNPDVKITVVGFCDYTGTDPYNWKLSQRRAEEVKRLMVKKYGIDADRITVDYKGKTVAFGDIQYSLNRRVSFYRMIE